MDRFRDRTAVVTGGGHGIGRASALRLAQEGAQVAIVDIRKSAAAETASLVRDSGGIAVALSADVSDPEQVETSVAAIVTVGDRRPHQCRRALRRSCASRSQSTNGTVRSPSTSRVCSLSTAL